MVTSEIDQLRCGLGVGHRATVADSGPAVCVLHYVDAPHVTSGSMWSVDTAGRNAVRSKASDGRSADRAVLWTGTERSLLEARCDPSLHARYAAVVERAAGPRR